MLARIRQFLAAPPYADEDQMRVARLLNAVLLSLLAASVVTIVVLLMIYGLPAAVDQAFTLGSGFLLALLVGGLWLLARRGHLRLASFVVLSTIWGIMTYWIFRVAGISSDSSPVAYPLIIVLAGLLLGGRAALGFTAVSVIAVAGAYYAEISGWLIIEEHSISIVDPLVASIALILTGLLLLHAMNNLLGALARARTNEQAQVAANRELETMRASLEQRVADRTEALERRSGHLQAAVAVSRAATSVLDPEQLVWQVCDLLLDRFDLYHVGLFLIDASGAWAEYRAGAGAAARALAEEGFRLQVGGQSLIGWCTARAQIRIAQDVSGEAGHFAHPDVSASRSEVAIPLIARGQILGALSVQSDRPRAFGDDAISSLQTMADQIAVALDNARLFAESQQALEATRRAYGELSRQAWSGLLRSRTDWGYTYAHRTLTPAEGKWQPEMLEAQQTGSSVHGGGRERESVLAIPLQVREQTIGALGFYKEAADGGRTWTAEETELLETLVQQLGVALESAQLFEETQRRAAEERILGEVTARMRETLDMNTVLQTAIREIGDVLNIAEVEVRLGRGGASTPHASSAPAGDNGHGEEGAVP